ncbi:MAG: translation initiation factor IF-2 [Bdellovibrionales bacterium]|nr:translation initiation factor IF-2 [Bdellovibrionales bacterium]
MKIYELAKELNQESRHVVEVVQRLGINIKNPTSLIGSEEARIVREYYKKQGTPTTKRVVTRTESKGVVTTEKRVGRTVIRRRSRAAPARPEPEVAAPEVEEASEMAPEAVEAKAPAPEKKTTKKTPKKAAKTAEPIEEVTPEAPVQEAAEPEAPVEAPKKKWAFPSIIKKVSTEKHLGDTIGPKQPKREIKPKTGEGTEDGLGPKRVKEINVVAAPVEAKDTGKRRALQRQAGVFRSADFLKRELVRNSRKKKAVMNRPAMKTLITTPSARKRVVEMAETITPEEFAKAMGLKAKQVFSKLKDFGVEVEPGQGIDHETASVVATDFGFTIKQNVAREEDFIPTAAAATENAPSRAPVVTIMGHVDHGKTSLLDKIRKTKVAEGEAGGITQHIGAYTVKLPKGDITFIDTPGHEAFTAMRARGAKATDIVILVVSATEGVMPQTVESINHAKAAGVPLIVAVNKVDLPDANPDKTRQTMANYDLAPEEWGGDTIYVNVSAKTGAGIDKLLESVLLHAELLELKAERKGPARGVVLESRMEKGRGAVATLLVQAGELSPGDLLVSGTTVGKVRALNDFQGKRAKSAFPSEAVEIIGLPEVIQAGESFYVMADEKSARQLIATRAAAAAQAAESKPKLTLEEMLAASGDTKKELLVVLKSDVQGSIEAVKEALSKFPQEKVTIKYLHAAVGGITESDVMLASASQGVIFGFNVVPDAKAKKLAEQEKVEIRSYRIIYELVDEVKKFMEGLVDKSVVEKAIGRAEVRDVFTIPKIGAVAGSSIADGKITRGCFVRLLRDSRVVYEGRVASLRRFKEDVKEVTQGHECGIGLENFNDIKVGDQLEAFEKQEIAGTL